jgi:mono/diheme cytochrome c family protein
MPAFPNLTDADITAIQDYLESLCPADAATGAELFGSNCATCHGTTGAGGRNGAGVRGPDIRCTESHDFLEKVMNGDDEMPAFPELDAAAISRIVGFVHGFCTDGNDDFWQGG